jgi:hypothetical protein
MKTVFVGSSLIRSRILARLTLLLICSCALPAQATLLFYDGFNYSAGEFLAPRTDTAGSPDPGQYNAAYDVHWRYTGAGGSANNAPAIAGAGLSYPGLQASGGNSVVFDMTQIGSARIQVGTAINTGTLYWSGLLRVNDVGTLTTGVNGMLLGGFNNSVGAQGSMPTAVGAVLRIRKDGTDLTGNSYQIGTGKSAATTAGVVQFDATSYAAGQTVFIVASYDFSSTDHVARMWINPDVSTFGTAAVPAPTLVSSTAGGNAFASISSFNLRNVNTVGLPTLQFDELRVGTEWASVTPIPEPASLALLLGGIAIFLYHRSR